MIDESKGEIQEQISRVENTTADLNIVVGKILREFAELATHGLTPTQNVIGMKLSERADEYLKLAEKQMVDFTELQQMVDEL